MAYNVTGTAGNDTLNQSTDIGPGTIAGLAGNDFIVTGSGPVTVSGDSGNDTVLLAPGNTGTVNSGTENDIVLNNFPSAAAMQVFGGDGADTLNMNGSNEPQTLIGGNDSSDGSNSLFAGNGNDLLFGNGGADSLVLSFGNNTAIGGFGDDRINPSFSFVAANDLAFGNQGNDTISRRKRQHALWRRGQ